MADEVGGCELALHGDLRVAAAALPGEVAESEDVSEGAAATRERRLARWPR